MIDDETCSHSFVTVSPSFSLPMKKALRAQIDKLKSAPPPVSAAPKKVEVIIESNKDMSEKIKHYQQFIGKYVVEAQEQKMNAVREAEARVAALYEGKINVLTAAAQADNLLSAAEEPPPPANVAIIDPTVVYDARNARVESEAAAGKSRWGDAEVKRIAGGVGNIGKYVPSTAAAATLVDGSTYPPAIIAGSEKANDFLDARKDEPSTADGKAVNEERNARIVAEVSGVGTEKNDAEKDSNKDDAEKAAASIIEKLTLEERLALGAALHKN